MNYLKLLYEQKYENAFEFGRKQLAYIYKNLEKKNIENYDENLLKMMKEIEVIFFKRVEFIIFKKKNRVYSLWHFQMSSMKMKNR